MYLKKTFFIINNTYIINNSRNQRRALNDLTEVQKMLYSTVKRWLPAEVDRNISLFGQSSVFLTQMQRRNRVQSESQVKCGCFQFFTNPDSKTLYLVGQKI